MDSALTKAECIQKNGGPHLPEILSSEWMFMNISGLMALIIFTGLCSLILKSDFVRENKLGLKFTKALGALILIRLMLSQIYQLSYGYWDVNHSLSLHLCGISGILAGICLIRYNQTIYEFLILLGAPGALWSFLTPQMNMYECIDGIKYLYGFLYFDYLISHTLIIFAPIYMTLLLNKRPRPYSYLKIFYKINILVIPFVYVVNIIIKSLIGKNADVNYMYLMYAPKADNPFIIDTWPWYIGVMEVVAFAHMIIIYSMFNGIQKIKNKINIKEKLA